MNPKNRIVIFFLTYLIASCVFNVFAADIFETETENIISEESANDLIEAESTEQESAVYEDQNLSVTDVTAETDTEAENDEEGEYAGSSEAELQQIEPTGVQVPPEDEDDDYSTIGEDNISNDGNIGENIQNEANNIEMSSSVINDENIVVYDFDELKSALSSNNGYVNIYIGADINMKPLGIEINSAKKRVLISGVNPLDGSGPFTINEYNSLDPGYTIRVVSNSGAKEVIMRDINITGRNYYGAICVYDGVSDVKVTYENVSYNGPQICYNRGGTVCITGKSDIRIQGGNGLSDAQELVEANALELGGNTVINHYAPVMSGIWLVGSGTYIKVLSGANVTWNESGTYMIFQDNTSPAELTLEYGARLAVNTVNGLFYNTSATLHQFGNVLISQMAALEIKQQGVSATPVLKVKNGIQALEGSSFIVLAQSAPQLLYMTGDADFTVTSPDTLALYNKTGKLIDWNDTKTHNISLLSSFLNYWSNPCDLDVLGNFSDSPQYRWRKKKGAGLSVQITASSSATKTVVSNYTSEDSGTPPNEETLNVQNAKVITAGKMRLEADSIFDTSLYISGQTEPFAELMASYTDTKGNPHAVYGIADSGGAFDIQTEDGSYPAAYSEVIIYSRIGYKNVLERIIVSETPVNALAFVHVPKDIVFPKTSITAKKEQVERADDNWHIIIEDTRVIGANWELYVRLKTPLSAHINSWEHKIDGAVIFKNDDGGFVTLKDTPEKAASGVKSGDTETVVGWAVDKGIMLYVDTLKVYSDIGYSAVIEWLLADAP